MERTLERKEGRLTLHLVFGAAVAGVVFSGVYDPSGERRSFVLPEEPERRVTLALQDPERTRSQAKYVVPVKSLDDHSGKLNHPTRFIAEKENPFSGKTTDKKTEQWIHPDNNPDPGRNTTRGSSDPAKDALDKGKAPDLGKPDKGTKASGDSLTSYSGLISEEQMRLIRKRLSIFQELPVFKNLNTELLINFSNQGLLSLGTEAFRHAGYFHEMVKKISQKWYKHFPVFQHYYGLLKEGDVLVVFELDLDGRVTKVELAKSYGQPTLEKACLIAVEGQVFGPIPHEYRDKGSLKIPFLFVYKRPEQPLRMFH